MDITIPLNLKSFKSPPPLVGGGRPCTTRVQGKALNLALYLIGTGGRGIHPHPSLPHQGGGNSSAWILSCLRDLQ
ncbi:MAG: hypothetical protein A3E19_03995 [Planctomycetes bacterium RIFCSPHIGHO2_12_FULL_52_36]|nr:MAG: hypothetical protein A3E19_03995 [Planctomycetes bacterium RIFCSPHIGHO2_12_FULL_52_36]